MPIGHKLTDDQKSQMHRDSAFILNEWQNGVFDEVESYVDHVAVYQGKIVGYGDNREDLREKLSTEFNVPSQCIITTYIGVNDYDLPALREIPPDAPQQMQANKDANFLLGQLSDLSEAAKHVSYVGAYKKKIVGYGDHREKLRDKLSAKFNIPGMYIPVFGLDSSDFGGSSWEIKTAEPQP